MSKDDWSKMHGIDLFYYWLWLGSDLRHGFTCGMSSFTNNLTLSAIKLRKDLGYHYIADLGVYRDIWWGIGISLEKLKKN